MNHQPVWGSYKDRMSPSKRHAGGRPIFPIEAVGLSRIDKPLPSARKYTTHVQ